MSGGFSSQCAAEPNNEGLMEDLTDSTVFTLSYEPGRDRQSLLDYYAQEMIKGAQRDPRTSTAEIAKYIALGGPCVARKNALDLFGGASQFRRTCGKMDILRREAADDQRDMLPLQEFESDSESAIIERARTRRRDECIQ